MSAANSADPVTEYAKGVLSESIVAGPYVRQACQRHIDDLEHGIERGLEWRPEVAARAIGFFPDILVLPEGTDDNGDPLPFELSAHQKFIVGSLFGWYVWDEEIEEWIRRFRTAYIEVGKGDGKSPLAAGIGLYMLIADGEQGAQVYSAATTRDQAKIVWTDAQKMVAASNELRPIIRETVNNLAYHDTGSFFRPVSADASKLDGFRPSCVIADEVHEHKSDRVINKMQAGFKGRKQPLIIEITNSGVDRTSVCYQHHEHSRAVLSGTSQHDSWFAYVCALDEDDDPLNDESCWPKTNPNLGVSITKKYLRQQVKEAKGMPSKESIVRRLNFCQWVDAANPWIDGDRWRSCEIEGLEIPKGRPLYIALDLSGKQDLTAMAVASPDDDDGFDAWVQFWTPGETMRQRENRDRVPYSTWVEQGHLTAPSEMSIDFAYVAQQVADLYGGGNVEALAFDPYRMADFARELDALGVPYWHYEGPNTRPGDGIMLVQHGQGYGGGKSDSSLWMPRSIGILEEAVLAGKLRVRKNPVLTWNSASAVIEQDAQANKKWEKRKSTGRIDGIVALCMAVGAADAIADVAAPSFDIHFVG